MTGSVVNKLTEKKTNNNNNKWKATHFFWPLLHPLLFALITANSLLRVTFPFVESINVSLGKEKTTFVQPVVSSSSGLLPSQSQLTDFNLQLSFFLKNGGPPSARIEWRDLPVVNSEAVPLLAASSLTTQRSLHSPFWYHAPLSFKKNIDCFQSR